MDFLIDFSSNDWVSFFCFLVLFGYLFGHVVEVIYFDVLTKLKTLYDKKFKLIRV